MDVRAEPQPADGGSKDRTACQDVGLLVKIVLMHFCPLLALACVFHLLRHVDPYFSVEVTGVEGLDPLRSPVISPDLNLTLHVDNGRQIRRDCREKSTVTISYNQVDIAWGEVPAFCVDKWSTTELDVPLSRQEVLLPQQLRNRMASDMHVGELELGVEMKPSRPQDAHRPCFLSCTAKFGEHHAPHLCSQSCVFY